MKSSKRRAFLIIAFSYAWAVMLGGCAYHYVIPESLNQKVDRTVSFASLQSDPESYKGRLIALGGMILEAKNLKQGTQIEVVELPLDRYDHPVVSLQDSQGRFLVLHQGYLETAVLRRGHMITIVGEVTGKKVQLIDEVEYTYPYLKAKFIQVWPEVQEYAYYPTYPYPYYYPYYYPYWYPWSPFWYPWGSAVIIVPGDTTPPKNRQFGLNPSASSSKGSKRGFQKSD